MAFNSMTIQKHCIKNVEGSRHLLTAINIRKSKTAVIKIDTATTTAEAQNKRIH